MNYADVRIYLPDGRLLFRTQVIDHGVTDKALRDQALSQMRPAEYYGAVDELRVEIQRSIY